MSLPEKPYDQAAQGAPALSAPRRRRAPLTTLACILYIVLVVAVLIIMRFAGEQWWFATLLLFSPRWLLAVPTVVVLPMALAFRRRLALPVILAGTTVLFAVMGFRIPWQKAIPSGGTHAPLRLFTYNLHGRQSNPQMLDELVDAARPDIILLQDFTSSRKPSLLRGGSWHTDRVGVLFVASRFPLHRVGPLLPRDAAALAYYAHGWPVGEAVLYEIDLPDRTIHLINVHLASPHQQIEALEAGRETGKEDLDADSARRTFESLSIATQARQAGGSVIIAGDFNTPDDSPLFRLAWHDYDDAFNAAGFGFGTTYANHHTWLRIDHILFVPSWRCSSCWVGPPIGSGHRPLMAVLEH